VLERALLRPLSLLSLSPTSHKVGHEHGRLRSQISGMVRARCAVKRQDGGTFLHCLLRLALLERFSCSHTYSVVHD
jgi:hypothetical protein